MSDTLTLANKITKALFPDIYANPENTLAQTCQVMGARGIVEGVLKAEPAVVPPNPAAAAIEYALNLEDEIDAVHFLRLWNEGSFDDLRHEYDEVPEAVFIGAEVGKEPVELIRDGGGA